MLNRLFISCVSGFNLLPHTRLNLLMAWSLVRRFGKPQKYKPFVSRCVVQGELGIGSLREVDVKSGLPATTCTERLELLDDHDHVLSVRIVGGDHRLRRRREQKETFNSCPASCFQFSSVRGLIKI